MTDFRTTLMNLRRPRLLIRAARIGAAEYRRDRDLRGLIERSISPELTVPRLINEEARMEEDRLRGLATYSVARHVEVLIALVAEVRLLSRPQQSA